MANLNDMLVQELDRRIRELSTSDLMTLLNSGQPSAKAKTGLSVVKTGRNGNGNGHGNGNGYTISGAILKVVAEDSKPLQSKEILVKVQGLLPGAQEGSIRTEISKLASSGRLAHKGPRIGGQYKPGKAA